MNLFILGVTGSIGLQTLDLVRKDRDKFNVVSVTCNNSIGKLREIIIEFSPLEPERFKYLPMSVWSKSF